MGIPHTAQAQGRPRKIVSRWDDAIDAAASDLEAYGKDHDLKHLTIREDPDSPPVWFYVQAIDRLEFGRLCADLANTPQRLLDEVFRLAVVNIEGLRETGEDGQPVPVRFRQEVVPGYYRRLPDEIVRLIPGHWRGEIGNFALAISEFSDELRRPSSPPTGPTP